MTPQLQKKLASWVDAGLLSREQAEAIAAHEHQQPTRPWTLYGIAGIGVTALVTGIVSIIAANWDVIPAWFKLLCYFSLQGAAGYAVYRTSERPGVVRETSLTLFSALVLAGIGLIAQTYNLHGDGWQALLLWVTLTLPAVWLAASWTIVHLWITGLVLSSLIWAGNAGTGGLAEFGRFCIAASVPCLLLAAGFWGVQWRRSNFYFLHAARIWGIGAVLFVGTPLGNALWGASPAGIDSPLLYLWVPWGALGLACVGLWLRTSVEKRVRAAMIGALLTAALSVTLPLLFSRASYESTGIRVFAALAFFLPWVLAATAAAYAHHKRWFDVASLVIALRIVVVYFEVFGSLAETGVGLILSGVVILAVAYGWHRFRTRVQRQLEGNT